VKFFLFIFLFFSLLPESVFATHEVDHRYVVSGYVRDAAGNPLKDEKVILEHKGGEKKTAATDRRGYYEVLFHFHDENAGDEILITAAGETKKLTADYDPKDHVTFRTGEINFGAPGKAENTWIYWTGGAGLLIGAIFFFNYFQKKRKKAVKAEKKEQLRKKKR
jgi:hypothetical protein